MIDWTKPIQTKAGEPAELLHTYGKQVQVMYKRLCVLGKGTSNERVHSYTEDGTITLGDASRHDIVNVPEEKVLGYIGVHPLETPKLYLHAKPVSFNHVITIKQIGDKVTAEVEEV